LALPPRRVELPFVAAVSDLPFVADFFVTASFGARARLLFFVPLSSVTPLSSIAAAGSSVVVSLTAFLLLLLLRRDLLSLPRAGVSSSSPADTLVAPSTALSSSLTRSNDCG